jgi:hypothetical protein
MSTTNWLTINITFLSLHLPYHIHITLWQAHLSSNILIIGLDYLILVIIGSNTLLAVIVLIQLVCWCLHHI